MSDPAKLDTTMVATADFPGLKPSTAGDAVLEEGGDDSAESSNNVAPSAGSSPKNANYTSRSPEATKLRSKISVVPPSTPSDSGKFSRSPQPLLCLLQNFNP